MLFILIMLFLSNDLLGAGSAKEDKLVLLFNGAVQSDVDEAARYTSLAISGFAISDLQVSHMQDAAKKGYSCVWCHELVGGHIEDSVRHTLLHRKPNSALMGCSICKKPQVKAEVHDHLRSHFPFLMCYACNSFFDNPDGLKAHTCGK